jgi:hypothetical protein
VPGCEPPQEIPASNEQLKAAENSAAPSASAEPAQVEKQSESSLGQDR